ncbi:MAG: hypothetical protein GYA86_08840 [Firmicutes bacterium]|nr:hypothetical protein [Bacillota bacterium]
MLRALALSIRVSMAISCNYFLHSLKRLPWVGKKIPDTVYRIPTTKMILSLVVELGKILFGFIGALLTLAALIFGPLFLIERGFTNLDLFYHYFFFIFFLVVPLGSNVIFQTRDSNAYTMVHLLKLDGRNFLLSRMLYTLLLKSIRYALLLLVIGLLIDLSPRESLMLSGYILFAALIWEALILKLFDRIKINIYEKTGYLLGLLALLLGTCYALPYLGVILSLRRFLSGGLPFALFAMAAGFSLWQLFSYDRYHALTQQTIDREKLLLMEDLLKKKAFIDVDLAEEKLGREKVSSTGHLEGYDLFNHLFFTRHRRIITRPVQIKTAIVAAGALLLWTLLLLKPEFQDPVRENILSLSPYFVFFMYLLSSGDKFSRMLFFNCDRYMLKEHYYKDKEAILKNFTLRLKFSIRLNLLPAAAVAVLLSGTGIIIGMGSAIVQLLPMVVTIFSLALFFSTHYLFIYYLLQPYTADLTRKSPLYGVINALIYVISFGSIHLKTSSVIFTLAVIFFTLAYTGAAILLTYHLAPRTFKLR